MSFPEWYAIDKLEESYEDTKDFLLPFDLRTWVKVAVIVFFIGGSYSSFPTSGGSGPSDTGETDETQDLDDILDQVPSLEEILTNTLFLGVIVGVAGLVLVFSYLSAVFEFIFYQSLEKGEPKLISQFSNHAVNGFKYFLFNWLMLFSWITTGLAILAAWIYGGLWHIITVVLLMIPVWIILWVISFYVKNLTLPEMVVKETEFIQGLKNAYSYIRNEWKQAGVFLLVKILIGIVASVLTGIVFVAGLVILIIPLAIIGIIFYLLHPWLVTLPILIGMIGLIALWFAIAVPVQTYIYQWVLNVYREFSGGV